jgi:short-subunit dehydrogenase
VDKLRDNALANISYAKKVINMILIDRTEAKIRGLRKDISDDNIKLEVRNQERYEQIDYLENVIEELKKLKPEDLKCKY